MVLTSQDYSPDACMNNFTPLQAARVAALWQLYRVSAAAADGPAAKGPTPASPLEGGQAGQGQVTPPVTAPGPTPTPKKPIAKPTLKPVKKPTGDSRSGLVFDWLFCLASVAADRTQMRLMHETDPRLGSQHQLPSEHRLGCSAFRQFKTG